MPQYNPPMTSPYLASSGMTPDHFGVFQLVASQLQLIIIVRNTNRKSTPWIAKGYPPKPMSIKSHTGAKTGKVTAANATEIQIAQAAGFYVLGADGIARRSPTEVLQKKFPFGTDEQNEPNQIIHPTQQRALVGDYDLLGVIDPAAKGRNITLVTSNGAIVPNRTSPYVERVRNAVNPRLDQARVMHGAQDQYAGAPDKDGSSAFLPNGLAVELTSPQKVIEFYQLLGRQFITGKY